MNFDLHIGIDYSGRQTSTCRTPALQVYAAFDTAEPRRILAPSATDKACKNWCRKEIAAWLTESDQRGILDRYFAPPLIDSERRIADLEGWILGII